MVPSKENRHRMVMDDEFRYTYCLRCGMPWRQGWHRTECLPLVTILDNEEYKC